MHRTTGLSQRENGFVTAKNRHESFRSSITTKPRILANVSNVLDPRHDLKSSKLEAAERQRANAERLAKGQSVVGLTKAKIENQTAKENIKNRISDKENKNAAPFRVPNKPLKTKKAQVPQLQKSLSVTSLAEPKIEEDKVKLDLTVPISQLFIDEEAKDKNELNVGIYGRQIHSYLMHLEEEQSIQKNYLTKAHLMTESMRLVLVDWMYEVQKTFTLFQDTVQIAIATLDRFIQISPRVAKDELQLVGVTCLFLASKYEEMYPPSVDELVHISANAFSKEQILRTEQKIFKALEFNLGRPPPIQFIRRYCTVARLTTLTYHFSKYFCDLALLQYQFCHVPPSLVAASAVALALFVTSGDPQLEKIWTPVLEYCSTYKLQEISNILPQLARIVLQARKQKQTCIPEIYSNSKKLSGVSGRPELQKLRELAGINENV